MSSVVRNNVIVAILLLLFASEAYCVTYYKYDHEGGFLNTTYLLIASGGLISVLPFLLARVHRVSAATTSKYLNLSIIGAGIAALLAFCFTDAAGNFAAHPIKVEYADMIPQIKVCANRFVRGEKVYAPMMEVWNGMKPTYMPMMWMAWIPCEFLTNDLRWTSVIFYTGGIIITLALFPYQKSRNTPALLVLLGIIAYFTWFIFFFDAFFIEQIEEPVVIGYYLLLGFGLVKKNPWITGIAAGCCLLSRYVLIFWIPVFLIYTFLFDSKRNALIMFGIIAAMELFIFVIPFYIWQPKYFSDVIAYYHSNLIVHNIEREHNVGLGVLFGPEQMDWLVRAELMGALVPPIFSLGIYYLMRSKLQHVDRRLFGICSLKLTMVFFYAFVEIPYAYLFFVLAFFTAPICLLAIRISAGEQKISNTGSVAYA